MGITTIFQDNTREVISAKDAAVAKALEMIGLQCEKYAKLLCPVDTSRLKNSITHEARPSEEAVYVGTAVEYAPYVEYGTYKMKAQPYLGPAVSGHTGEYKAMAEMCLKG